MCVSVLEHEIGGGPFFPDLSSEASISGSLQSHHALWVMNMIRMQSSCKPCAWFGDWWSKVVMAAARCMERFSRYSSRSAWNPDESRTSGLDQFSMANPTATELCAYLF